jgi:hypothetical protein
MVTPVVRGWHREGGVGVVQDATTVHSPVGRASRGQAQLDGATPRSTAISGGTNVTASTAVTAMTGDATASAAVTATTSAGTALAVPTAGSTHRVIGV